MRSMIINSVQFGPSKEDENEETETEFFSFLEKFTFNSRSTFSVLLVCNRIKEPQFWSNGIWT